MILANALTGFLAGSLCLIFNFHAPPPFPGSETSSHTSKTYSYHRAISTYNSQQIAGLTLPRVARSSAKSNPVPTAMKSRYPLGSDCDSSVTLCMTSTCSF